MTTIAYLLIDVDGVLIPFPDSAGNGPATHVRHLVVPTGYDADKPVPIWLNPAHGPMLTNLFQDVPVAPVWCTSWHGDASTLIGPKLGLPPLPHVELGRPAISTSHPNGYLWKRDPVTRWLGSAPAAWIDDDFTPADHAWAAHRTQSGIPTLLIQPDPMTGLEPSHLDAVRTWALGITTESPAALRVVPAQMLGSGPSTREARKTRVDLPALDQSRWGPTPT
ncbi:HAD domain-containing protein [Microtetraspora fusca]|uniref:HAD domain-containing protein n=1 Tax=Microtetraspora fusca TaxID=1997 RepID=UPI00082DAC08|nr:HAD domain-containing protein [Microtetraspora fusca]